jgi:Uracil DNA glycosylase superfamily
VERRQSLCSSSLDQQKRTATKSGQIMVSEFGIVILPDLLANNLDLVIVGTAAGRVSAKRGLYYAGPGNRFWRTLHEVGLTPIELQPDDYAKLLDYRIGLTDFAKGTCGADSNLKPADFGRMRLRSRAGPTRRPAEAVVFGILPDHGIFAFSGHWRAESENCPSSAQKSDRLFSAINPAPVSRRPLCDIRPKALPRSN